MNVKLTILGDSGVGKTSISECIIYGSTSVDQYSTIGAGFMSKVFTLNGDEMIEGKSSERGKNEYKVNIWDTAGSSRYRAIIPMYFRDALAILYVFDLNNRISYENLEEWFKLTSENIKDSFNYERKNLVHIVIGNKKDKTSFVGDMEVMNDLEYFKDAYFPDMKGNILYFKTSCLQGTQELRKVMSTILNQIVLSWDLNGKGQVKDRIRMRSSIIHLEEGEDVTEEWSYCQC